MKTRTSSNASSRKLFQLLVSVAVLTASSAWGADITARITVDNAYSFGWGSATQIAAPNYYPQGSTPAVLNTSAGDIFQCPLTPLTPLPSVAQSGAEVYPNLQPTITDYLYVIAWSDDAVLQGVLADFRDNVSGNVVRSGDPGWEVYATGVDFDTSSFPTLAQVNQQIAIANAAGGSPATTSIGWVGTTATSGRIGTIRVGGANGSQPPYPTMSCLDGSARWMWYSDDAAVDPFVNQTRNWREFLIFRLPVSRVATSDQVPTYDPCCPPWNPQLLGSAMKYQGSGGINAPFTLKFSPSQALKNQIQAYIDYVSALNPGLNEITIAFRLHDAGTGPAPIMGAQVGNQYFVSWKAGGNGAPSNGAYNLFQMPAETMQINRWYTVHSGIYLEGGQRFFPEACDNSDISVRLQVTPARKGAPDGERAGAATRTQLEFRTKDGRVFRQPIN